MSRNSANPKSLKGTGGSKQNQGLTDEVLSLVSRGSIVFNNVEITSGTIDGVLIGGDTAGPGNFTSIQAGDPQGKGFPVCFYGNVVGDSACWEPITGTWNIQGDLIVRDISDLGSLRVSANTLSSTNPDTPNINIVPRSNGLVRIVGGVNQTASSGNVSFSTSIGNINLSSGGTSVLTSNKTTSIVSALEDIKLVSGQSIQSIPISMITSGETPVITTAIQHNYNIGDTVFISSSGFTGSLVITEILSSTSFRVNALETPITQVILSGTVKRHSDIFLDPLNDIKVAEDKKLVFGPNTRTAELYSDSVSNTFIVKSSGDVLFNPSEGKDVIVRNDAALAFGENKEKRILGINDDIHVMTPENGSLVVNGNLKVMGITTTIKSEITTIKDPVITIGENLTEEGQNDNLDRGIEIKYKNGLGQEKIAFFGMDRSTGCFTYIPDAINNGEIFEGAPGCARFGNITSNSVTVTGENGGGSFSAPVVNTCNIYCENALNITGVNSITTNSLNTTLNGDVSLSDGVLNTNINGTDEDSGILFRYFDEDSQTLKQGFFGWDNDSGAFTVFKESTETNGDVSGTRGDAVLNNLTIEGDLIGVQFTKTVEHLFFNSPLDNQIIVSNSINITYFKIQETPGEYIYNIVLPQHNDSDGFEKIIGCVGLFPGSSLVVVCPEGTVLDSGSGTKAGKKIIFDTPGQSLSMVYDKIEACYIILNSNTCMYSL